MHIQAAAAAKTDEDIASDRLLRRVGWRVLPLLVLLYLIAYLDRINIGFAAASMQRDLHFSDSLYGTGAGLFFFGYLLAQVPSNLMLARIGARRMIASLMIIWGLISGSMAFVHSPAAFLVLRFLLGVAEAGFFPGVILYLTLWMPRRIRGSFTAYFLFGIPLASVLGGPMSTWVLQHGAMGSFADWQLLLLTQATPAVLIGCVLPRLMADSPADARWLSPEDRTRLARAWSDDEPPPSNPDTKPSRFGIGPPLHVLLFAAVYFTLQFGLYAQSFWLPKILRGLGVAPKWIGWQVAAVYAITALAMLLWGRVTDHWPLKRWTLTAPLLVSAAAYALTTVTRHSTGLLANYVVLAAFGLGAGGALAGTPPFWGHVTLRQRDADVPGMIAAINALGNLGGFAGPALLGLVQEKTGSYAVGMLIAAGGILLGTSLVFARREAPQD
ncbi:MAG TPA: MFS transporter [Acidobacteriaceae bacterium]|jgi:ACS family tartrate transporter-like MFS transporter|nr:MFS transporter [Acidobacteriaceae bacterium]